MNYSLRHNKNVERKMLVELFNRLDSVHQIRSYKYIGFGSYFFNDFRLLHARCGITRMTSFEDDYRRFLRAQFNRPFSSVEVIRGNASKLLAKERWTSRSIVWMDYEIALRESVLRDIQLVVSSARAGSIVLFTVRAEPPTKADEIEKLQQHLRQLAYPELLGILPTARDLAGWGTAETQRFIVDGAIRRAVRDRNRLNRNGWPLAYRQLVNFNYADNAKMMTVGGLIFHDREAPAYESAAFETLEFYRDGAIPFQIDAPTLTTKEVDALRSMLPRGRKTLKQPGLTEADVENFSKLYRHYPTFAESEVY